MSWAPRVVDQAAERSRPNNFASDPPAEMVVDVGVQHEFAKMQRNAD